VKRTCEILGLGSTAVDEILFVPRYPEADSKVQVRARERSCGGLTATALVAGARLGARCSYAGCLGDDDDSRFVLETFRREGVDVSGVSFDRRAGPIRSVIVVDEQKQSRAIFYHTARALGAAPNRPTAKQIQAAKVLLVDRFGIPGMVRAARLARQAGVAVVADFEHFRAPQFEQILPWPDHLVVSDDFARGYTGQRSPARAAEKLWTKGRAVVVVTCGAQGCWYLGEGLARPLHFPAFRVRAVDTTGCGDVFHGAYAAGLVWGWPLRERVRFASATAALKATRPGGQAGIPTRKMVERFLSDEIVR
jgi:sugar/nucleoside kinase (ribokinase family)